MAAEICAGRTAGDSSMDATTSCHQRGAIRQGQANLFAEEAAEQSWGISRLTRLPWSRANPRLGSHKASEGDVEAPRGVSLLGRERALALEGPSAFTLCWASGLIPKGATAFLSQEVETCVPVGGVRMGALSLQLPR